MHEEATNEQTPPPRLRELAQINSTLAGLVANNPNAPCELLTELASSEEDFIRKNVAANPNTPTNLLWWLGEEFPTEVLENAVFPLLLLENPNLLEEIPQETIASFLKCSAVPISFMEWAVKTVKTSVLKETHLSLAMNSKSPRNILEKLALNKDIREAAELHVNYAGELEEDWQEEFSRHLNRSPAILGDERTLGRNVAEHYYLDILTAMGLVSEFLFFFESLVECEQIQIRKLVASLAIPLNLLEKFGRDHHPHVRAAVARNPIAPAELLECLAKDKHSIVRAGAAENPNASPQLLERLARKGGPESQWKVAKNPNAPTYLLEELAGYPYMPTNLLAANPNAPVEILEKLEDNKDERVRSQLAGNPSTPKYILEKFALREKRNERDRTRQCVASNPQLSEDTIHLLAGDKNPGVRRAVATNPKTPLAVLLGLSRDEDTAVRIAVAANPKAPFSLLEKNLADLFKFRNMEVKTLLRYLREKPEGLSLLLELIAKGSTKLIRIITLWHPQMPPKVLAENARSLNWLERCAIAQNPNTPTETLQLLAADGNRIVRAAAKENLKS